MNPAKSPGAERPLVLILDDDSTTRDLYGNWFWWLGYGVMCAVGREGLRFALRRDTPRLIVSELHAGDLALAVVFDELTSADRLRGISVVVLTRSTDPLACAEARSLGAAAILPKFCDLERLQTCVNSLCPLPNRGYSA